jgi:transposase
MRIHPKSKLDLESVRRALAELLALGKDVEAIELVLGLLEQLRDKNTQLELELMRLLRRHVGKTSERVSPEQLRLVLDQLDAGSESAASESEKVADTTLPPPDAKLPEDKPKSKGHGRRPLPAHLPRVVVSHPVPAQERACSVCGAERVCIGHERSEVIEFIPASFRVELHEREKLACRVCEEGVTTAPLSEKVIEKGRPGPGLLAHVVTSKYADHIPLNRLSKIYAREGVHLAVSTLADWVAAVADSLAPLAERTRELVLASHLVQADDTGLKVLDDKAPGGSKRGHLWCYVGDAKWTSFVYTPDWRKEGPQSFLAERRGWLQADAYKGYDGLFSRPGATAVEVGCWSHGRRGFVELFQGGDVRSAVLLEKVQRLYAVEREANEAGDDHDARRLRRERCSRPVIEEIGRWCAATYNQEPPKSALAKAIGYLINQWEALMRFLEDGRIPLDNTLCERILRIVAIGRKNYLFAGSDIGAERAATIYTMAGTCALNGVQPLAYFTDVLRKLETERFPLSRIDELLPPNWMNTAPESALVRPSR